MRLVSWGAALKLGKLGGAQGKELSLAVVLPYLSHACFFAAVQLTKCLQQPMINDSYLQLL